MGCVNCKKTTSTTNTTSTAQVPSGNVLWDGTAFSCALDPSLDTSKNDNLNTVLLRIFNKICKNDCCFVNTTYSALTTMITGGTLTPGTAYVFPYQTIHNIDNNAGDIVYNSQIDPSVGATLSGQTFTSTSTFYDGISSPVAKGAFTAGVENLIVYATSASTIDVNAYSVEYPNDIIHYDHSMSTTEDGTVNRPGFIIFRHDTDLDISAGFDWRNVVHRRYELEQDYTVYDRTAEWDVFIDSRDQANPVDFPSGNIWGSTIPAVGNFAVAGDTNLGGLVTAVKVDTWIDYPTFIDPSHPATEIHNVHIKKNSPKVHTMSGSGFGTSLTTGQFNGTTISNVVLLGRSISNVEIGANVSGVWINSSVIKGLTIGNEVQNVIAGGAAAVLQSTGTGYIQDVSIGDMSRDICLSYYQKDITIGTSNIGVFTIFSADNIEIGNGNNQIFMGYGKNHKFGSFNKDIFLWNCYNTVVGDGNDNLRMKLVSDANGGVQYNYVNTMLTPGFEDPITTFPLRNSDTGNPAIIGNGNSDAWLYNIPGFTMGGACSNVTAVYGNNLNIGNDCNNLDLYSTANMHIGSGSTYIDVANVNQVSIGDTCNDIHLLNTVDIEYGTGVSGSFIINASNGPIRVGSLSTNIYLYFSSGGFIVGERCNNISARNLSNAKIGNYASGIYIEFADGVSIGDNCSSISMSPLGHRYMLAYPFAAGRRFSDLVGLLDPYSPNTNLYTAAGITTSQLYLINYSTIGAAFPNAALIPCDDTKIGDNCSEIGIVSSQGTTIEDNCNQIYVGTYQDYSFNVSLTYDGSGNVQAYDEATVVANATFDGKLANNNTFEDNCKDIRVIGPEGAGAGSPFVYDYQGNHFGEDVIGIYTDGATPFSLRDTSILLRRRNDTTRNDLATLTLTASYASKVYDRRSPDGELWEQSIDNTGVLQTPTKLA